MQPTLIKIINITYVISYVINLVLKNRIVKLYIDKSCSASLHGDPSARLKQNNYLKGIGEHKFF